MKALKAKKFKAAAITCTLCNEKVDDDFMSKQEHIYQQHPAVFFQNVLEAVPKARHFGSQIANAFRMVIQK
jgi:hypothetical protein